MLGVGGVGLFCGRVHLQKRETKGNQGKSREIKGNQGKSRNPRKPREPKEPKGNKETKGNQGKSRETGESKGNQGKPKENQGKPLQSTKEIPSNQWEYLQSIGFLSKQG